MKAMLYADWMNFRQTLKSLLFMIIVFAVAAFMWSGPSFFCMIVVMVSIMVPLTLCSADKAYGWDRLSLSMPILRRDVVGSKFVLSGLSSVLMTVVGCVLSAVYCVIDRTSVLMENINAMLICEAVALVLMGIILTAAVKWGIEKARYIMMACVWIPIIAVFLLSKLDFPKPDLRWLNNVSGTQLTLVALALIGVGLLVYLCCYAVSLRIYQKTEL
ncbi:ABC-2 transporter permease [Agathobaculum sp.]|uniref:ABC-2 transporter permease n=1 Tax=Agathobaculum sp. TaxID=2048138 RepID=UPI002A8238F5|nr:ABC-2 transporter permease [Agathobaculum sp.]MDY3617737.1 ABC-2 transporter permease [Agathobaculum sp.]